ncbi:DUF6519 domain-containing protein [Arthrobacter sp. AK04]|uniref:DUF6519 domain-containing protein n=1 Tax=Arthrobacter sp. AK04 TaxID=2900048 RepID=UPI001E49E36A|nr:DUF6519 domain-containing protein [Arthrobacter sp. AK04]MCD5341572.1 DUF6519 domain-containing protein [Arthrobacter sp. AK04]
MKGDFTRETFDRRRHYTRVLMQQGRVQLDADWNEQTAIAHHYLRTLAADLIGGHGGPATACGFAVIIDPTVVDGLTDDLNRPIPAHRADELKDRMKRGDFLIGLGRYYVDGLLCECDTATTYAEQLGYPFDDDTKIEALAGADKFLIYLDVWERHVSGAERPDLLDVALSGLDTATRAELVWQVKVLRGATPLTCDDYVGLARERMPLLRAQAHQPSDDRTACVIDPEARYRGAENQLYRIEIHRSGDARPAGGVSGGATFVWSRENGSVLFSVLQHTVDGDRTVLELASLGRDYRSGLTPGDWVQLADDASSLRGAATPMLQVESVNRDSLTVVLTGAADGTGSLAELHPVLRRWDHNANDPETSDEGALLVREATSAGEGWIELEDGVMVQFPASAVGSPNDYRTGDYWLVPARAATGDVVWPQEALGGEKVPRPRTPDGVQHHYAPLAVATRAVDGTWSVPDDCRFKFTRMPSP